MYEWRMQIYNDMLHEFDMHLIKTGDGAFLIREFDSNPAYVEFYEKSRNWYVRVHEGAGVLLLKIVSMILENLQWGEPNEF